MEGAVMTTKNELDLWQQLTDAVEPGEWVADADGRLLRRYWSKLDSTICECPLVGADATGEYVTFEEASDLAFIVAARKAMPQLIARVRQLELMLAALEKANAFATRRS
jgi:hypothetical protein